VIETDVDAPFPLKIEIKTRQILWITMVWILGVSLDRMVLIFGTVLMGFWYIRRFLNI
jgi:hypothetical protein